MDPVGGPVSTPVGRAIALLAALALVGVAACSGGSSDDSGGGGAAVRPADEGIEGVLAIRIESADHPAGTVDYDRHPPAGGDHNAAAAPCGFYTQQIADEYAVHTVEHGAVWLAYAPDLPAADIAVLRAAVADDPDAIATPYPGLEGEVAVVVTAWARQLSLTSVTDPRLEEFVERYANASTAPEATVACAALPPGQG